MFSRSKNPSNVPSLAVNSSDDVPSIIAADLKIAGNLICGGAIEIEGEVEGNITCGQITIRKTGSVRGDVTSEVIHIDGEVDGMVKGKMITISDTGRVSGIVIYESLSVREGAYIDGQCKSADKVHRSSVETLEEDIFVDDDDEGEEQENSKQQNMDVEEAFA